MAMEIQVPGLSQCVLSATVYDVSKDNSAAMFTVRQADYKHLGRLLSYNQRKYITVGGFGGQGWRAGLQYTSSRVQTRTKPSGFQGEIILSMPSFGGEVKPSVTFRRFAAYKRSLNLGGSRSLGKITGHFSRTHFQRSLLGSLASLRTYRHLASKVGTSKVGESNGKLPPRTFPGCSAPEPHRPHDWALVPANPGAKAEY